MACVLSPAWTSSTVVPYWRAARWSCVAAISRASCWPRSTLCIGRLPLARDPGLEALGDLQHVSRGQVGLVRRELHGAAEAGQPGVIVASRLLRRAGLSGAL